MSGPGQIKIVILGLSITSSWGNGHATTYRGLVRELCARGHDVLFLERNVPWYAENRDLPLPPYGRTILYSDLAELKDTVNYEICNSDVVVVGSYVPQGIEVGEWVLSTACGLTVFYDIDTPVTLANLGTGQCKYLTPELIPRYQLYLSFTGGPMLEWLVECYGSPMAKPLYCSFDPEMYYPEDHEHKWDLGYLGTYSDDRQPCLDNLMLAAARRFIQGRFVVAGPQYPENIRWPKNVERVQHLPPAEHRSFYNAQRFTLNVTRADMIRAGYSPSVRLFEAAACATPIISDYWDGLESFFQPGVEILVSQSSDDTLFYLQDMPEEARRSIGCQARRRVLAEHTAVHRAEQFEEYALAAINGRLLSRG